MRRARLAVVPLALVLLVAATAATARADGAYIVRNCFNTGAQYFDATYEQLGGDRVDVLQDCAGGPGGKAGIYQDRSGLGLSEGTGGRFRWTADNSLFLTSARVAAKLKNANGIAAHVFATEPNGGIIRLDEGRAHDGTLIQMDAHFVDTPRHHLIARLACLTDPPCSNQADDVKAFFEVESVELGVVDTEAPTAAVSGALATYAASGEWRRGTVAFSLAATDRGSGVRRGTAIVNGTRQGVGGPSCPGDHGTYADRIRPCPASATIGGSLNTAAAPFRDGTNTVQLCAKDYSAGDPSQPGVGNESCTSPLQLRTDNTAPADPLDLELVGGSDWRPDNGFAVRWETPPGQAAPIAGAHYRIETLGGAVVSGPIYVGGSGRESLPPLTLPAPGEYRIHVWLQDAAGNVGQADAVIARFDDRRPTEAAPHAAGGWISEDELPYAQSVEKAQPGGPSGVRGYAVAVAEEPVDPCGSDRCGASETDLSGGADERTVLLGDLPEGTSWVSSAAVSGATLRSEEVRSTALHVDRTDPVTSLTGAPEGWANRPVTLTASARDAMSGMAAAPAYDDGSPYTAIRVGEQEAVTAAGARATTTIGHDGVHRVRYWAEDLAGNANDDATAPSPAQGAPSEAMVRIDMTAPRFGFANRQDPEDPELVRAVATDPLSGVAEGEISYRPAGEPVAFIPLPTDVVGNELRTRFPSERVPRGAYEFRATGIDRAGNRGAGSLRADGSPMVLQTPLKTVTSVSASFAGGRSRLRTRFAGRPIVSGSARDGADRPLRDVTLVLIEEFAAGSSPRVRHTTLVTDGTGKFATRLRRGPSRVVRVRFAGTPALESAQSSPLRLARRGGIGFGISPGRLRNGEAVAMRGWVARAGTRMPGGGKLVALQYFDPGRRRWRPVDLVRTNRRGRFRYRYRFRTITTAQKILFRAVAVRESGWPYLPVRSRKRAVVVYP